MNPISAIRYTDAIYFTQKEIKYVRSKTYVAIGRLLVSKDFITISFTDKNNHALRGLLVPNEALILGIPLKFKRHDFSCKVGDEIGIFWKDIVYFENGKIPKNPTKTYTEGKFYSQDSDVVVIKDPETTSLTSRGTRNHPERKPSFYIIPKRLITGVEIYDKKI